MVQCIWKIFFKHILLLFLFVVGGFALAEHNRVVQWETNEKVLYFDGNIYFEGSVYRFRTKDTKIIVPYDAVVEILAVYGFRSYGRYQVFRPIAKKEPLNVDKNPVSQMKQQSPLESEYEEFEYESTAVSSPDIDSLAISEENLFEKIDPFSRRSSGKKNDSNTEISTSFGLQISQDKIVSQGVLGTFDGDGISQGIEAAIDIYPEPRVSSPLFFSMTLNVEEFNTESKEIVEETMVKETNHENSTLRLRIDTQSIILNTKENMFSVGIGIGWEKLPFFETVDESSGKGQLKTKTSIGYSFLSRYSYTIESIGAFIIDFNFMPIGARTKSTRQADLSLTQKGHLAYDLFYLLSARGRYQKLRFPKESSANIESVSVFPKTERQSYGFLIGVGLSL